MSEHKTFNGPCGTKMVYMPGHPRASFSGRAVYEHVLVMEEMIGRHLSPKEAVHHKDGNPSNNDPSNLMLMSSRGDHVTHHRKMKALENCGDITQRRCWMCGEYGDPREMGFNGKASYFHKECKSRYDRKRYLRRKGIVISSCNLIA